MISSPRMRPDSRSSPRGSAREAVGKRDQPVGALRQLRRDDGYLPERGGVDAKPVRDGAAHQLTGRRLVQRRAAARLGQLVADPLNRSFRIDVHGPRLRALRDVPLEGAHEDLPAGQLSSRCPAATCRSIVPRCPRRTGEPVHRELRRPAGTATAIRGSWAPVPDAPRPMRRRASHASG